MAIFIFALICAVILLILLLRSISYKTKERIKYGTKWEKLFEILKVLVCIETVAFIVVFAIVLIRTMLA